MFDLAPEITRITGITDEMLEGQRIDRDAALTMLSSAELLVAHHAVFDLAFAKKRLRQIKESAWACSCHEVDWAERGYEGRALGWLMSQSGLFTDTHRAAADVWALFTEKLAKSASRLHECSNFRFRSRSIRSCPSGRDNFPVGCTAKHACQKSPFVQLLLLP